MLLLDWHRGIICLRLYSFAFAFEVLLCVWWGRRLSFSSRRDRTRIYIYSAGLLILHSSHLILYQLRCMGTRNYRFVHRSKRTNVPAYIQSTNTSKSSDSNVARRFSSATKIASTSYLGVFVVVLE